MMSKQSRFALIFASLPALVLICAVLIIGNQANAATGNADQTQAAPLERTLLPAFMQNTLVQSQLQPPRPCYGPHLTANLSKTSVRIYEMVIAEGLVCPPAPNQTVEVTFIRPDYTYINQRVLADEKTGQFSANLTVDMPGFWNVFFLHNHIADRLFLNVTDPGGSGPPQAAKQYPPPPDSDVILPIGIVGLALGAIVFAFAVLKRDRTRKISSLRLLIQILFVILIFTGIFINMPRLPLIPNSEVAQHEILIGTDVVNGALPDGLPIPAFACYYACGRTVICPLWQIQTYIYPFWNTGHGWAVNYNLPGIERVALVFAVIIIAAVVLGRFWCGWICPFGLYLDLMTKLRKALKIRHRALSSSANERLHQLSYVILAATMLLSVLFASQTILGSQVIPGTEYGGFTYTYFSAPFCQVCPMKPLCMLLETATGVVKPEWTFATTTGQFWQLGYYVTSLNLVVLGIVTAAAFFFRRSWCRICPLGGLVALFNRYPPFKWISGVRLEKEEAKCDRCGICKRVCPTQATSVYERKSGDVADAKCIMCLRCVEMCPQQEALKFKVAGKTVCKSRNWL
jgi:NAD-dependent dihydropyrimidine dehydrogenase PreA subunit